MALCATCGWANADEARFCSHCGTSFQAYEPVATARKVVTVLVADVSGFTALGERLDPESLQRLMGQWFDEAQRIIASHGGTVEKYMGDAVMALFGVPVVHEDDALRGARAALEMRDGLIDLNETLARRWGVRLDVRTGLNTGEAIIGTSPGGERSTVGDTVNVAERVEAAARPGEVLIGEETARLVGSSARLEAVDGLIMEGQAPPVAAWRLLSLPSTGADAPMRVATPLVDREDELRLLCDAFREVTTESTPRLVTVLGPAGIGKSRLAEALLNSLREDATAVVGRCLPYGDGITYWPVAEIVRQLSGAASEAALAALVGGGKPTQESELIASRVARAAGFASGAVPVEEARWGVRKLLEGVARRQALIVVVEDIHWAEPTLLDLLEHLATQSINARLFIVCLARPELLDKRPAWVSMAREHGGLVRLEPLSATQSRELIEHLAGGSGLTTDERGELLTTAEGNPLFLQQMVAMRTELGDDAPALPPTIQPVLTARIDGLPRLERAVIERASIEGRIFHRGALAELLSVEERKELDDNLARLVDRQLIRPGPADFPNEQGYSFDHILIRDATYSLIPKQVRADLHERHAHWLERRQKQGAGEYSELAGYHLEQAFRFHVELEPAARDSYRALASAGGRHLGVAGSAALARDDPPAAISLLERAIALLPDDDDTVGDLEPELGMALTDAGRLAEAGRFLEDAAANAAERGDSRAEARARVAGLFTRLQVDTDAATHEARERFESLLDAFAQADDDLGLGRLWQLRGLVHWIEARSIEAEAAWDRAAKHARLAGDERGWAEALSWLASSAYIGPTPVADGIARCEHIRAQLSGHRRAQALVMDHLAGLRAMQDEVGLARSLLAESKAMMADFGVTMHTAVSHDEAFVAMAAGDLGGAEAVLRAGYERLDEMGEKALLATTAAMLAHVLEEQGRAEEAWAFSDAAQVTAADDDLSVQIMWRAVRARLLARRGAIPQAKRMSAEAVRLAERTDWLTDHADALISHAQVLRMAGDRGGAEDACDTAVALYSEKGNRVGIRRARAQFGDHVPA